MTRTTSSLAAILAACTVVAACSGGGDEAAPSTTEAATTTSTSTTSTSTTTSTTSTTLPPITTTTVPDILRMPLTGEPITDAEEIPDRPALVVKIDNHPSARPQTGLNEADIVFEENVENLTRFAAVFHTGDSDPVGPIRSGRHQDINMFESLSEPLFAWSGGNASVQRAITDSDLIDIGPNLASGYYRRSGRGGAPHNLYSSTDALWANTPEVYNVPDGIFAYLRPDEDFDGEPATEIEIEMSNVAVTWEYDEESNRYYRWQNGQTHETELTGQVWVDNVVVFEANYFRHPADGNPTAETLGSNPVTVFADGEVRTGVWLRFTPDDRFGFFDNLDDLNEVRMPPGRTFVEVAEKSDDPEDPVVTWS